ncbi:hypothetical protein J6590_092342 [Homalodisca vitripennis]|nr:hypothetical protein J6590_092342 [Homalodisca vitripennis]
MWRLSDFWKCDVVLGTPPLEKAQEALTALTVFLPFPGTTERPYSNPSASVLDTLEVCQVNSPSYCWTLSGYTTNCPFEGSKQINIEF